MIIIKRVKIMSTTTTETPSEEGLVDDETSNPDGVEQGRTRIGGPSFLKTATVTTTSQKSKECDWFL